MSGVDESAAKPLVRRPATMDDVARMAAVSKSTVSRALMRPDLVAEETRRAVLEAVRRTGYRLNGLAQALRRREARAILVLVPDIANPFYGDAFRGMAQEAEARGYSLLVGNTDADPARESSYLNLLLAQRADGVVLLTGRLPRDLPMLSVEKPPIVLAFERVPGADLPIVRIDNVAAAEEMVRHLIALGHRRIGHVTGPASRILSIDRLEGYRRALDAAGIAFDPDLVADGAFTLHSGIAAGLALLSRAEPPTAIFAANDESAVGVARAARERGLRVPEDLSVAGFDDSLLAESCEPPLTTIRQPRAEIGARAVRMLIDRLEGREPEEATVVMTTELVPRGSTRHPHELRNERGRP